MTEQPNAEALGDFLKSLGANSAEIIRGIYSTPWTAIPFTVAILAVAEVKFPGATNRFWGAIAQFFAFIETAASNALGNLGTGTEHTVTDILKRNGANPTAQPGVPNPPPPAGSGLFETRYFAKTLGFISGLYGGTTAQFLTATERDKWVSDFNGSFETHLTGNYVTEVWDQTVDDKGQLVGQRVNDTKLAAPKPWWVIFA